MQKSLSRVWLSLLLFSLTSITLSFGQQRLTPHNYIDRYKSIAQQLMQESGVPASVILAVAIHESAYGNSRIARHLNNHFGIKGKNQSTTIRSAYKGYESILASYQDFIALLKRKKTIQPLFDKGLAQDYEAWTLAIARSGYSVTTDWRQKVLATINRYNLDEYDTVAN